MKKALTASAIATLSLAAVALMFGCGGSSDATSSPPPKKAAYLEQVTEICERGQDQHDRLVYAAAKKFEHEGKTPKVEEEAALAFQDPYEETTQKLAELTPPRGGDQKMEALIEAREQAAEKVSEDPSLVFEGHPYRQVEKLAKSAGVIACII